MLKRHHGLKSSVLRLVFGALLGVVLVGFASGLPGAGQNPPVPPSVWDGVFSAEQALRGEGMFLEHCSLCHGEELQGTQEAKALKGDRFWTDWKESTVDYMLERISKSMPFSEDGSLAGTLPERTYVDIVAHILHANGFPAGRKELTSDSTAGVQIIRKEGPGELPAATLARVVGCLTRATDGTWKLTRATSPVRVRSVTGVSGASLSEVSLGNREYVLKFVLTPLEKFAGYRLAATGLLIGEGGKDGLNLSSTTPISPNCE
jgi:hypothetical protein